MSDRKGRCMVGLDREHDTSISDLKEYREMSPHKECRDFIKTLIGEMSE